MLPRMKRVGVLAGAVAAAVVGLAFPQFGLTRAAAECGLPAGQPLWIDYGEGSVKPDTRAVLARPGVVVASSGTAVPAAFRKAGAATVHFELHLPRLVGQPTAPADPSTVVAAADALYARAVASTGCATPWIALNELLGSNLATPWSPANTTYRANVLAVVRELAAKGAHPALLVHGDPTVAGDAGLWWRTTAQSATLVYEAYYDASKMYPLGSVIANRRMRLGMRNVITLYGGAGVPPERLGFMLGFHSALTPGIAGRQGLQPTEAWLRVVKWEALSARQVATEAGIPTIWSWGWGTFGPESVDPDKPVAACTWLWARDPALCDAPTMAGPAFSLSRVEGQIVVPQGIACTFADGRVPVAAVTRLTRLTKSRHLALTAQFARAALANAAPVDPRAVLAVERRVIAQVFHGKRDAYARALARRGADVQIARGVIADTLQRQAIARRGDRVFDWIAAREKLEVDTAICLHDELPGVAQPLSVGNAIDVGTVPLASFLSFLFRDRTAPATPAAPTLVRAGKLVTVTWQSGTEPDLAGYVLVRTDPGGAPRSLQPGGLIGVSSFVDTAVPDGAAYALQAVDTSGNRSALSQPAAG
jgi:hypothetical protein